MSIDKEKLDKILEDQKAKSMIEILAEFDISATRADNEIKIDLNGDRYAKLRYTAGMWEVIQGAELGMKLLEKEVVEYAMARTTSGTTAIFPTHLRFHSMADDTWLEPVNVDDTTYATSNRLGATRFDSISIYEDGYIELWMCGHVVRQLWTDALFSDNTGVDVENTSYVKKTLC